MPRINIQFLSLSALVVALGAAGSVAYAANEAKNDAVNSGAKVKITLIQAIASAEQYTKGRAVRAEYEPERLVWGYNVEIVSGAKVLDVRVDADKGTVISAVEDRADQDEHDDHES